MIASKVQPSTVNQIVAVACSALILAYNIAKSLNQCSLRDQQVKKLERAAVHAMREQREKFIKLVQDENLKWDQMLICACKETFDLSGVTEGLDNVLGLFGKEATFHNISEYENQLDQTIVLNF